VFSPPFYAVHKNKKKTYSKSVRNTTANTPQLLRRAYIS